MTEGKIGMVDQSVAGCPIDPVIRFLALKWLVHIVWLLGRKKSLRFSELRRHLPGDVSTKVLAGRLKELRMLAVIEREDKGTSPPHVVYRLTSQGRMLDDFLADIEPKYRQLNLPDINALSLDLDSCDRRSLSRQTSMGHF